MDQVIRDFILALRGSGVRVSVAESIDAMKVVDLVGYDDREVLKDSLAAILAKSFREKEIFERCFKGFFSSDIFVEHAESSSGSFTPELREGNSVLTQMIVSGDGAGLAASMRSAVRETGVTGIRFWTQKGFYTQEILRRMGWEGLQRDIKQLYEENTLDSLQRASLLNDAEERLFENAKSIVEQHLDLFSPAAKDQLFENYLKGIKLSGLEQQDFHRMYVIIQKMVKRLNDIHSRRRKTFRRGQLDFRRTLRSNITYGGLLFDIKWKKKKIDRPNIIALCDVSNSVSAVARFLLLFLYSLNRSLARIRTFIFCSNLVEVSHVFDEYPVEEALVKLQSGEGLGIVLGSTDYGRAYCDFKSGWFDLVTNKTTVLILGDARNNYGDPETGILRSIQQRCKRLVWLNPEPRAFWGMGDSEMNRYLPYCHLAKECNTVSHLERVVDSLLHRE